MEGSWLRALSSSDAHLLDWGHGPIAFLVWATALAASSRPSSDDWFTPKAALRGEFTATGNMDQLVPGRPLLNSRRGTAPEVEAHQDGHKPEGRATVDQSSADQVRRSDTSNFLAAVRSLAANHSHARRRSAKPAGSLEVAQRRSLEESAPEELALEYHRDKPQPAGADLGRWSTAGKQLGLE